MILDQLEAFAHEVLPAFKKTRPPSADVADQSAEGGARHRRVQLGTWINLA